MPYMLKQKAASIVSNFIANCVKKLDDAGVYKRAYYAYIRDALFDKAGERYKPETYLTQMHEIVSGRLKAEPLAVKLEKLGEEYDAARRGIFKRQVWPALTTWYLSWLYVSKLDSAVGKRLLWLFDIVQKPGEDLFTTVRQAARRAEGEVSYNTPVVPAVVAMTTPAMSVGAQHKRRDGSIGRLQSKRRSPSRERGRSMTREISTEQRGILKYRRINTCYFCGKEGHVWEKCWGYIEWAKDPANRGKCIKCHRMGHSAR